MHRLFLIISVVKKPVMKMSSVRSENGLMLDNSSQNRKARIKNRQAEYQNRNCNGNNRIAFQKTLNRHRCHNKAQEGIKNGEENYTDNELELWE